MDQATKNNDDARVMPPPPLPRPVLLEPKIECLKRCLQNAMLKTGQVYAFYGDTRRLGISKYAINPPQALSSSLGKELEKYDQLCDAIESHLLRAIAILQRDLQREERKQIAVRLEKEVQMKLEVLQGTQPINEIPFSVPAPPNSAECLPTNPRNSPTQPGVGSMSIRRPSAISISSLQRPPIPLKLDTSSSRMTAEEGSGMYPSGLASPVGLVPKSARIGPDEFADEFMAAFSNSVDRPAIDLTLAEHDGHNQIKPNIDTTAGDSSDKPIELDLDMSGMDMSMNDLFGDNAEVSVASHRNVGMFEYTGTTTGSNDKTSKDNEFIDLTDQDLFTTLSNNSMAPSLRDSNPSLVAEASSPGILLASGFSQNLGVPSSLESAAGLSGIDHPFDMASLGDLGDLGAFNPTPDFSITDMDVFLNMGASSAGGGNNESPAKAAGS